MKIVINATNLKLGGAVQVLEYLLSSLVERHDLDVYVFASTQVQALFGNKNQFLDLQFVSHGTPSRIPFFKCQAKKAYDNELMSIKPDLIFTLFGPSHWVPKHRCPSVVGFANAVYTTEVSSYFVSLSTTQRLLLWFKKVWFRYLLNQQADYFIVQTAVMKDGLRRWLNCKPSNIFIVPNGYDENHISLTRPRSRSDVSAKGEKAVQIGFVGNYYPHKNFEIIPPLLEELSRRNVNVQFNVTITQKEQETVFAGTNLNFSNWGPISHSELDAFYDNLDFVFFPSVLESYSAVFAEAVATGKVCICADLPFSRDIMAEYAVYFKHNDPIDAANAVCFALESDAMDELAVRAQKSGRFLNSTKVSSLYIGIMSDLMRKGDNRT